MDRLEYLFKQDKHLTEWYKLAEEKARFLVTINTFIVAAVNGFAFFSEAGSFAISECFRLPVICLLIAGSISLVGSFIFVFNALWPRHHSSNKSMKSKHWLWFFGDLVSMSEKQMYEELVSLDKEKIIETMIHNNHNFANNIWRKHVAVNWSIAFTILSLLLFFTLCIVYIFAVF